jgi:hypothetical protein
LLWFGLVCACTPTPEKVCGHAAELSKSLNASLCTGDLSDFQHDDQAAFATYAKCVMDAKNEASLHGCASTVTAAESSRASSLALSLAPTAITLNGRTLSGAPTTKDFASFGLPTREEERAGNISRVYDGLGIELKQKPGTDRVIEMTVFLAPQAPGGWEPERQFAGSLEVGGVKLSSMMNLTGIEQRLAAFTFDTPSYLGNSRRMQFGSGGHVYFESFKASLAPVLDHVTVSFGSS